MLHTPSSAARYGPKQEPGKNRIDGRTGSRRAPTSARSSQSSHLLEQAIEIARDALGREAIDEGTRSFAIGLNTDHRRERGGEIGRVPVRDYAS